MIGANAPAGSDDRIGRITTVPSLGAFVHCGCLLLRSHIANCAGCADSPPLGCLCALRMPAQVPLCTADDCYCSPTLPIAPAVLTCPPLGCPCALRIPAWVPFYHAARCPTEPSFAGCGDMPSSLAATVADAACGPHQVRHFSSMGLRT